MSKKDDGTLKDGRKLPIFIHSHIDDMTDLTPNTMRVYMHLARRADKSGAAWPSYQSIGDHCFQSITANLATRKSFARKAVDDLIEAGLLAKEMRTRADGGNASNVYVLLDDLPVVPHEQSNPMPNKHRGVLNRHSPVPNSPPMPNQQTLCLTGTKDTPIENSPVNGSPVEGLSSSPEKEKAETDGEAETATEQAWAMCRTELAASLGRTDAWLEDSTLEATDQVQDGKHVYRLTVGNERHLPWLKQMVADRLRRSLSGLLKEPVAIDIVAAQATGPKGAADSP